MGCLVLASGSQSGGERPLRQRGPRWGDAVSPFSIPWGGPLEMTFLERNMLVIS